jgi:outer membrane protein assembly factor BamB
MKRVLVLPFCLLVAGLTTAEDWPTYLHDPQRSAASSETRISPINATHLVKLWEFATDGPVAASPTVVGGTIYIGSWDGYEYALNALTGTLKWKTNLGISKGETSGWCRHYGVTSTATVDRNVVYVGGGKPFWYALSATTGKVLWKVRTGDERSNGRYYNWASPLVYKGYAYVGVSSKCDEPLVQGQLLQVELKTHRIVRRLDLVPSGQVGGALWTSPAVDTVSDTIYITTGNEGSQPATSQPYARAVVALSRSLAVKDFWQVPDSQTPVKDSDWGGTPTLFQDAQGRKLLAAVNKNGDVYVFDRRHLKIGPLWRQQIADPDLNISSAPL